MFRLIWGVSVRVHYLLRWAPTNLLVESVFTRRGLKWGVPTMFIAVPLLLAAAACSSGIHDGGPGWLSLLVALFIWDALKFTFAGPVSIVLLIQARRQETRARRRAVAGS
ncbi:sulfate permease [Humibacter ginsenosidimutans]|uniref:Sulfate permease n=1 Tax=Humibacter ginsenosidimutans TaxID=2599293 RepID=A0A5B8M6P0_9MICO|nr:sulfate permease [Humibacter ginsenosidimutans]QDZ15871.1 sulfate permease [Humibacter ginsenosidimutans]